MIRQQTLRKAGHLVLRLIVLPKLVRRYQLALTLHEAFSCLAHYHPSFRHQMPFFFLDGNERKVREVRTNTDQASDLHVEGPLLKPLVT